MKLNYRLSPSVSVWLQAWQKEWLDIGTHGTKSVPPSRGLQKNCCASSAHTPQSYLWNFAVDLSRQSRPAGTVVIVTLWCLTTVALSWPNYKNMHMWKRQNMDQLRSTLRSFKLWEGFLESAKIKNWKKSREIAPCGQFGNWREIIGYNLSEAMDKWSLITDYHHPCPFGCRLDKKSDWI